MTSANEPSLIHEHPSSPGERQADIVTVTLNRPEQRNALSRPLLLELTQVLQNIGGSDARGVIIAANGPVFSAGHHFADMAGQTHEDV